MDDWQKDFWEVIETVALGIETFFQEVAQTIEEINEEIIIDLEQFIQEVLPQELEEFFNLDESLFSELDEPSDFLTPILLVSVAVIITVISTGVIFSSAVSIPTVGIVIVVLIGKQRINYFSIKSGRVIIPTHSFYLKAIIRHF